MNKYSPLLNYEMIISMKDVFSVLDCYEEALELFKKKSWGKCYSCSAGNRNIFAQTIRNELIEKNRKDIFIKLDPRTIIRYGDKIYRAGDFL